MSKAVNLYLASGEFNGIGFWEINFYDNEEQFNRTDSKLIECYRKELFGIEAAVAVKGAITNTLDILVFDSNNEGYKIFNPPEGYSSEIPLNIIEDIFDLWAYNYHNESLWLKYLGVLNLRKKLKTKNNFIYNGLKGKTYEFAIELEKFLSFRPINSSVKRTISYEQMW